MPAVPAAPPLVAPAARLTLMQGFWKRFLLSLTPAVRLTLTVWSMLFVVSLFAPKLDAALFLAGPAFFHGEYWQLLSYAMAPANLQDLIFSAIAVLWFGGMLERVWRTRDFFLYCFIAAVGSGLAKIVLQPGGFPLAGPGPVTLALVLAAGRLFANETMFIPPNFQLTMWRGVLVLAGISIVLMVCTMGWLNALIRMAGAGCGIFYLWLRAEIAKPRQARPAVSQRINRLEL